MNIKSAKKMIDKDIDKLNVKYAKGKIYIQGIIKEQKSIIDEAERAIKYVNEELDILSQKLEPYADGKKETDDMYYQLKNRYQDLLVRRVEAENAIVIAEESIAEAKLNRLV